MKKLVTFFIILVGLMILAGCNHSKQNTTNFDANEDNGSKTTITTPNDNKAIKIGSVNNAVASNTKTTKEETVQFAVTSFSGDKMTTEKSYNLIQGTTPKNTAKIKVNDYTLTKYQAGQIKWSYIASTDIGTLKKGSNTYKIIAFDSKGAEVGSKTVVIEYQGSNSGVLVSTGNKGLLLSLMVTIMTIGLMSLRRKLVN